MSGTTVVNNIEKVVVNVGVGRLSSQQNFTDKLLPEIVRDLSAIVGQHPSMRPSRKSIAGFKVREGAVVGLKVTLRGRRALPFIAKVANIVMPRIRDFRGISPTNVDTNGNLNIGIKDHLVFPELNPENSKVNFGIQITLVPKKVKDRAEAIAMYKSLGIPLRDK